jgi:hypothetical protein
MQSSGGQPEADAIMHKYLHAVGTPIGKKVGGVRVGSTEDLNHQCQGRVNTGTHV